MRGKLWDVKNKRLVASTVQEGVFRVAPTRSVADAPRAKL